MSDKIEPHELYGQDEPPFSVIEWDRVTPRRWAVNGEDIPFLAYDRKEDAEEDAFHMNLGWQKSYQSRRTPDARLEAERAVIEAAKEAEVIDTKQNNGPDDLGFQDLLADEMRDAGRKLFAAVRALAALARTEKKPQVVRYTLEQQIRNERRED